MKLLLDTCVFLWVISGAKELSAPRGEMFSSADNEVYLSPVSCWEIIVKNRLGRLPLPERPDAFIAKYRKRHGIASLPLSEDAALQLSRLPDYHKDPFDRMLICQAISEGMAIMTPDPAISQYPVRTIW